MMKGQLAGLMRQAQQVQEKIKKAQDALADMVVEGQAGSGLVKVQLTGKHELKSVTIDPSLMTTDADDRETLQDLIIAAVNDAAQRVEQESNSRMSAATAGMPLPPGFKF
ncbi:DNA_YbaB_EbfC, DNA-binding protein, YbaB/EbfC family [Burkholderiales bacterium]